MDDTWTSGGGGDRPDSLRVTIWLASPKGDTLEHGQRPPVPKDARLMPEAACRSLQWWREA